MTSTIINKIFFIILIALSKRSILDLYVNLWEKLFIPRNIVEKSSSMTPYESMHKLMSRYATIQNQFRLYQLNAPIFSITKSVD